MICLQISTCDMTHKRHSRAASISHQADVELAQVALLLGRLDMLHSALRVKLRPGGLSVRDSRRVLLDIDD